MVKRLTFTFLLFTYVTVQAQYKVGVHMGYNYGQIPSVNTAIQHFNFTRPDFTHAALQHGFYGGVAFSYAIIPQLYLSSHFTFHRIQSRAKNFVYEVGTILDSYTPLLGAHLYPLALNSRYSSGFAGSFFVSGYVGAGYVILRVQQEGDPFLLRDEDFNVAAWSPVVGFGAGVDLYTANRFSFTPEIMVSYYFPFEIENLTAVYASSDLVQGEDEGGLLYLQAGINMRFHSASQGIRKKRGRRRR